MTAINSPIPAPNSAGRAHVGLGRYGPNKKRTAGLVAEFQRPVSPAVRPGGRGDAVGRHVAAQHIGAVAARARPHADGAVFRVAAERDVLGMHAAAQAGDAGAETGVVEARARGHAVGLLIGQGGERRTHAQRRPAVLGAEGIEVEGEGGGGGANGV